jgi:hypothetical protein
MGLIGRRRTLGPIRQPLPGLISLDAAADADAGHYAEHASDHERSYSHRLLFA